uniref:hypothetical protein n=1 Tax=Neorhizobium sp. EC2-8 TaxID=3129230 RepID=UPI00310149C1
MANLLLSTDVFMLQIGRQVLYLMFECERRNTIHHRLPKNYVDLKLVSWQVYVVISSGVLAQFV